VAFLLSDELNRRSAELCLSSENIVAEKLKPRTDANKVLVFVSVRGADYVWAVAGNDVNLKLGNDTSKITGQIG
jgi:hypothetical protein